MEIEEDPVSTVTTTIDESSNGKTSSNKKDLSISGVELNQPRLLQKAIRQNCSIRRHVDRDQLLKLVHRYIPSDAPVLSTMLSFLDKLKLSSSSAAAPTPSPATEGEAMELEATTTGSASSGSATVLTVLPEVEIYLFTLIITTLLRDQHYLDAASASQVLIHRIRSFNRRSLDVFSAKAYFYFSLAHERLEQQLSVEGRGGEEDQLEKIRPSLLALYRTAAVRHDEMGQAVLLNCLLRNYLSANLYEAAHTLSLRANFPEQASNNQYCRYLYYMGRIQAVQLDYSEAYQRLTMAARKAPSHALGFTRQVQKLIVLVQLLMGDIPERSLFNTAELRVSLSPYLALTQAVRTGDLLAFQQVMERYKTLFEADHNFTLVQRLGHNVLKTGLRKISLSYSRISLAEIATKLHLASATAAEYICAKAIRDGVMEAQIDHANGWLTCQEVMDIYSTEEPQKAFHKRIAFCLDVHNEAVKSMRYPPEDSHPKKNVLSGSGGNKDQNDDKTIDELLKEMEEDFDE
eukprot:gene6996-7735_t